MPNLNTLLADGNSSAARRARVRLQPRDKKGRWIPTGAALFSSINGIGKVKGKAIGGTATKKGEKNNIRMLVGKGYESKGIPENTVLTVDPKNGELESKIKLSRDYLKKKGIDPDVQHTLPKSLADMPQDLKDMDPQPADDLDIELATGGLNEAEDKDFRAERSQEPLAKLPPAMEVLEGEEVSDLVDPKKLPEDEPFDNAKEYLDNVRKNTPPLKPIDFTPDVETDPYNRPMPFGRSWKDPATGKVYKPIIPGTPDKETIAVYEIFHEINRGGDAPDIDELIDKAKTPPSKKRAAPDLKDGDVIVDPNGDNWTVVGKPKVSRLDNSKVDIQIKNDRGQTATTTAAMTQSFDLATPSAEPKKPVTEKPKKPVAARKPKPTPSKEKPEPKPKPKPKTEKVNLPNRKDDGKDIAPTKLSTEELRAKKIDNLIDPKTGKLLKVKTNGGKSNRTIEDPNAIIDALLEVNPNAKIKEDGTVVMERGSFTDTDGKEYNYEVGVQRTVGNQFMERYTISDPDTGEVVKDFYNADYKDSFSGLYGKASGLERTRDLLLGKDIPGNKGTDEDGVPVTKELKSYFGPTKTLENRLTYLRGAGKSDINWWRLLTPEENIDKYLDGRDRKLNESEAADGYRSQYGNVRRSFIADIYEAIGSDDSKAVKDRLVEALGRLPDNPEAKDILLRRLSNGIDERFKGTPKYNSLKQLPNSLNKWLLQEEVDLRDKDKVPFVSEDGVSTVKVGDRVRFINNDGDMAIGTVVKLVPGSGRNGDYKDTARVQFNDRTVDNLQTRNMRALDPTEPDSESTDYAPWVRLDEKIRRRADELGINYEEYLRRKQDNPDYDPNADDVAIDTADAPKKPVASATPAGETAPNTDNTSLNARGSRKKGNASSISINKPTYTEIWKAGQDSDFKENDTLLKINGTDLVAVKPTDEARAKKEEVLASGAALYEKISDKLEELETPAKKRKELSATFDQENNSVLAAKKAARAALDEYVEEKAVPSTSGIAWMAIDRAHMDLAEKKDPTYLKLQKEYDTVQARYMELINKKTDAMMAYDKSNLQLDRSEFLKKRQEIIREALVSEGVQLNTVKVEDFGSRIAFSATKASGTTTAKMKEDLNKVFEFVPRPLLEALLDSGASIKMTGAKTRGHMESKGKGPDGNERYGIKTNVRGGDTFDVTLHELWHVFQAENPDLVPLEHALLYDRSVNENGEIPGIRKVIGYSDSREKMVDAGSGDAFAMNYSQKFYGGPLDPSAKATEVSTVLMQSLFSKPEYASGGSMQSTHSLLVKYGKGARALEVGVDVYYNPADGQYYEDSAFSIPVNPDKIAGVAGRPKGDLDTTSTNFALGLLIGYGKSNG